DRIVRPEGKQRRSAISADRATPPVAAADDAKDRTRLAAASILSAVLPPPPPDDSQPISEGFVCLEGLCLARHFSGATVAHALDPQAALDACPVASVIVIDDATAGNVCRWKEVLVVTKRDLALDGSAAITFLPDPAHAASGISTIEFAISRP